MTKLSTTLSLLGAVTFTFNAAIAASTTTKNSCALLPKHDVLKAALTAARIQTNGGFNLDMWATLVDRDGNVCAIAFTGKNRHEQWPGSRVISAQKANTANAFSLPALALSTANLYTATQPGGPLFGLQASNPVDTSVAYGGLAENFGASNDPMIGKKIGGINVFGGGLALYNADGKLLGAIGVSGDSSCADHNIAWRTRQTLGLNKIPAGVGPNNTDGIDYKAGSGWAHPLCSPAAKEVAITIGAGL